MKRRWRNLLLFGLLFFGAAVALWYWGVREPVFEGKAVSEWLVDLDQDQPREVRKRADAAIRQIGPSAVPEILGTLERRQRLLSRVVAEIADDPIRYPTAERQKSRALEALRILGPAASNALPALTSMYRRGEMLSEVGSVMSRIDPVSAVRVFSAALSVTNVEVRSEAVWGLENIATNAESAIPQLLTALSDSDMNVRRGAASALGRIHKRPEEVVPALAVALADTNWVFRSEVLEALRQFGADAKPAVPFIERCLDDTNPGCRAFVAATLWYVDLPSAERAGFSTTRILNMLQAEEEEVRVTGLRILWLLRDKLQSKATEVLPAVIPFLGDTNDFASMVAVWIVQDYGRGQEVALKALVQHLEKIAPQLRGTVTNAILKLAPEYFVQTNR